MHAWTLDRVALALALTTFTAGPACAGGGHGAGGFHRVGGFRGGLGAFHGGLGGFHGAAPRFGGGRGLPPVAGVIHEGPAGRPTFSAYGHTNTAARFGGFARGGVPGYGRGALPGPGVYGSYGHADTGLRYAAGRRFEPAGYGRRRFATGRGFLGGVGGGFGGYGGYGSFGNVGGYGGVEAYGQPGTYGGQGIYGQTGTYGGEGTYGQVGTYGGEGFYDGGSTYRSETPLAARFAEPPLGPSPGAPYSPGDRYAYAASDDVGPAPRIVNPYRTGAAGCACAPRREPTIYRYGVGTAY